MTYPAIVYMRDRMDTQFAGNKPYKTDTGYQVTVIDPDPDSEVVGRVSQLPKCTFDRHFVADDLNQDVFTIYF